MHPDRWTKLTARWSKVKQRVRSRSRSTRAEQHRQDESGISPPSELNAPENNPTISTAVTSNAIPVTNLEKDATSGSPHDPAGPAVSPTRGGSHPSSTGDVWSKAYAEALQSLGEQVDATLLKGERVTELFQQLREKDKALSEGSSFRSGLKHLQTAKVPLETIKLALDLASPIASIGPTASMAVGVVKATTALAVTVASADLDFAKMIGDMLEHIAYIDDCDTLGQKIDQQDIHKALVLVYRDLLDFYLATYKLLQQSGLKMLSMVVLKTHGLPEIIQEFVRHTDNLRAILKKATLEIAADIKNMLYNLKIDRWLDLSIFKAQSEFHDDQKDLRADEACAFILNDQAFLDWFHTGTTQRLVVIGGMGSGKTNVIGFIIDELSRRRQHDLPHPKTFFHYCHNGDLTTCTARGVLVTLILSLLEQLSGLQKKFVEWHQKVQEASATLPSASFDQLKLFLADTVAELDRSVYFVIDGLDECDDHSQTKLIRFFHELSENQAAVKILFSTRPHKDILDQFDGQGVAKVDLAINDHRNITIAKKVVEAKLNHLPEDTRHVVAQRLAELSDGIAIWITKTVDLIRVRRMHQLKAIQNFLQRIPLATEMSSLYAELLKRYTSDDEESMLIATKALEIITVARRPLSVLELASAVAIASTNKPITTLTSLDDITDSQRVLSLINPFIRRVQYDDPRKRQVQLAHLSVRDFVLQAPIGTQEQLSPRVTQRTVDLETEVTNICISYLLLEELGSLTLLSDTQAGFEALPQETDLFSETKRPIVYDANVSWEVWEQSAIRYDPVERGFGDFFVYASTYWISHVGCVESLARIGLERLETLCDPGSLRIQNWIEQNRRPDCTLQPRYPFDPSLYDPLGVIGLYGSDALLQDLTSVSRCVGRHYLPDSGIRAVEQVLTWGDVRKLSILYSAGRAGKIEMDDEKFFRYVMWHWKHVHDDNVRDWAAVFNLVRNTPDAALKGDWGFRVLEKARDLDCQPMVRVLEESGAGRQAANLTEDT